MTGPRKPWLRLWDRSLDLPKAQRLTGDQFKSWINLLMLANRQDEAGRLPAIEDVAFALRMTPENAQKMISALVSAKLIDKKGSVLSMHDWESWQPAEKTSAQRSHEYREEQKKRALVERSDNEQCERSSLAGTHGIAHAGLTGIGIGIGIGNGIKDPPNPPGGNGAVDLSQPDIQNPEPEVARLEALAETRWPLQEAPRQIRDLCGTFDWRLVREIMDQDFAASPKKFRAGWERNGCRNQMAQNWKPSAKSAKAPQTEMTPEQYRAGKQALEESNRKIAEHRERQQAQRKPQ